MGIIGLGLGKELLGLLVTALIGKAFAWWKKRARESKNERYEASVACLEVAVHELWVNRVKAMKQDGGKLNSEQREELYVEMVRRAREVGEEYNVDPLKVIGGRAMRLLAKKIIDARKRK
jgi:hypothetical protein